MNSLEFYFDYRSPYSYLAFTQFANLNANLIMVPFDILDVMKRVENVPTSVICGAKNRYVQKDLKRWAELYGVQLNRHPKANEIDARRLLRATLAAGQLGDMTSAAAAIFHARWRDHAPLETSEQIAALLGQAGFDKAALESMIDDAALDKALDELSAAAAARGVFGAPTFFVGEDMYFGNDRLDFVRNRLEVQQ
ncbi:2-hydroxychromene-2-carboxylate isomerase [Rhodoferax sp.]|uniref:2-hydroxychromene-2-carboxylate isomerase n=1 Tax=Rhodoferax sp. TaxID=50421 RepID=UPI001EB69904|nr:2-hydroxychromene-2-carboxylate isomerase [Rhodoferax sp.]MBT9507434.1 2-hydroxychromene-2-carboxylate isomerase [Rhodoferax sp.]